jgi:hypothetical protein
MTQEAAEAPPAAPPDPHDAVGEHPDAAPRLPTEIEQQEAAATKLREMIDKSDAEDEAERAAQEAALSGEPQGNTEKPIPKGDEEGAETEKGAEGDDGEHQDTDEEAAAKAKRDAKPSFVREARRREKAARKAQAETQKLQEQLKQQQEDLQRQQQEFQQFQQQFQADPIGAMSRRLNIPPDQLVAQQADAQANQVPPTIQTQIDAQRREFEEYKASVEEREAKRAKEKSQKRYEEAVHKDIARLSGISETEDAERFPYYASLSKATRERRAYQMLRYTVEEMENPDQFHPNDLLEALDEQAKADHDSLLSSKFIKQTKADPGQETRAPEAKAPRRRPRGGPSARGAAEPAAPRGPMTEAESIEAAAEWLRKTHAEEARKREEQK